MSSAGAAGPGGPAAAGGGAVSFFAPSPPAVKVPPAVRRAPASPGQASLWFLRQVMPCKTPYNTAVGLRLSGEIDAGALVARCARWRGGTRASAPRSPSTTGRWCRSSRDVEAADVAFVDVAGAPDPEAEAERVAREAAASPFDLARGPLLRVRLVRIGAARRPPLSW